MYYYNYILRRENLNLPQDKTQLSWQYGTDKVVCYCTTTPTQWVPIFLILPSFFVRLQTPNIAKIKLMGFHSLKADGRGSIIPAACVRKSPNTASQGKHIAKNKMLQIKEGVDANYLTKGNNWTYLSSNWVYLGSEISLLKKKYVVMQVWTKNMKIV